MIINPFIFGVAVSTEFKITVDTTQAGSASDTFILRLWSGTTNMTVYWGDGNSDVITTYNQAELTHVYASSGTYQISCDGSFVGTEYYGGDKLKIMSIDNWGSNVWSKALYSFDGCSNMVGNYTDVPNTSNVTDMGYMFRGCTNFNSDVSFDTSSVTTMISLFQNCTNFDQPVSFDTSSVTNMNSLFSGCTNFNQSISFNTSVVTNMASMFSSCSNLNSSITFSDSSNVTNMASTFRSCLVFNQAVSFNTSSVTLLYQTFFGCTNFDQDVSGFNISSLTNATGMLQNTAFSTTNYDLLLVAWQGQTHNNSVPFHAGTAQYNTGAPATARAGLITDLWTITDGGQIVSPYLVDNYSPIVAYSVDKISSTATVCCRIRRASDNAEQDIGFSGDNIDDTAVVSFVGIGNVAFITKIYNQGTGSTFYDISKTVASEQPRYVIASNSFDMIDINLNPTKPLNIANDLTFTNAFTVAKIDVQSTVNYICFGAGLTPSGGLLYNGSAVTGLGGFDGTNLRQITGADLNEHLGYFNMKTSKLFVSKDGNAETDTGSFVTSLDLNEIGGRSNAGSNLYMKGEWREMIFFNSDETSNKTAIELDINTRFSIYP